jgi:hypothetical protein
MPYPKVVGVDDRGNLQWEPDVTPYVIRTTDRGDFKRCRRMWNYKSALRLNREPVKLNRNLGFGIGIHKGLEAFYHPDNFNATIEERALLAVAAFVTDMKSQRQAEDQATGGIDLEREEEYKDMVKLGTGMLNNYAKWAVKEDDGWKPVAVERKIQVHLVDPKDHKPLFIHERPVVYQVRVDLLARDSDGLLWVWDHKTAAHVSGDTQFLDVDTQLTTYALVVGMAYNTAVGGVIYNELAKSVPSPPKVLSKGGLSQDKRQNTTYELYRKTIDEMGLDTAPYGAMLEFLRNKEQSYFRRTPIRRNARELEHQYEIMVAEVRDMLSSPFLYPNPSKINCSGCDFRHPCLVESELGDVKFVLYDPMLYRERQGEG